MKRLMDAADTLLAVDSTAAPQAYHEAYDQLLWAVVTSARDELEGLVGRLDSQPYMNLPPPLQVAAFRIWGLEPPDNAERMQVAATGIAVYCRLGEENTACSGLNERQRMTGGF